MTTIARKIPLEKMQAALALRLQIVMAFARLMQSRLTRAWSILIGTEKTHHGGGLLDGSGDSLRLESSIATALNCVHKAIILQKMHEWIEYNKSKRDMDKRRDGAWWTYNSYSKWRGKHFGWLSTDAIGRHVRGLETMGLIRTGQYTSDSRKKWYTINYSVLTAFKRNPQPYLALLNLDHATKKADRASKKADRATKNQDRASAHGDDSNTHDDSSSKSNVLPNSLPNLSTQSPTKPGRGGWRADAGRKGKAKEALTDKGQDAALAGAEPSTVKASMGTADDQDISLPNSAKPLSHAEADLMGRMADLGLEDDKAIRLIDQYGANRVRAVVRECERRWRLNEIRKPAGWIIKELENDVFKLGEAAPSLSEWIDSDSHTATEDAKREERMCRETERLERLMAEEGFEVGT